MKIFSLLLVALSSIGVVATFGFSTFSFITGIIGGLIAAFAISGYLQSVRSDYPNESYVNKQVKYQSNYNTW
ncbi:hypothetical protein BSK49_03830 [Paenibacillus odorifer]|jgi:hypothetical protein|uniref:DUF2273 domain-containing protein n=1 Tax=Paenibacillus odorifer TaxID=189426 RepID=A0ABX3GHE3_9BACL|nr:hypothetical protein [Paenibacillus odorifer]OMD20555.1 hypothetical protein BSO21_24435 [Paenibacillus odorifer]OMD92417.1 hypothetical protein BSK49_03830 [Paenibacillus odorifer]